MIMLVALLVMLGVNLAVIVALAATVVGRKRWVKRQPGAFRGAIRVSSGDVDDLRPKWSRGYGRWVRDVFVWTKAPLLFRNEILAVDGLVDQRAAGPDEIKRLGDQPTVIRLDVADATVEVAASNENVQLMLGPYRRTVV
jgi:hypothetical protein